MKITPSILPASFLYHHLKSKKYQIQNVLYLLLFLLMIQAQDITAQNSYVFNGSISSDWNESLNWLPNGVPSVQDTVLITTSTLDASTGQNITIAALYLLGGAIIGSDTLFISDTVSWTWGRFEGPGTTVFSEGSSVFMHGDRGRTVTTRDILWNGDGLVTGTGTMSVNGAEVSIGGRVTISGTGNIYGTSINQVPPKITIRKEGLLIKNGSDFINSLPLDVLGRIELDSGTLTLNTINNWTGEFAGAKGTTLWLSKGQSIWSEGSSLTTDGNLNLGTTMIMDGTLSVGNRTEILKQSSSHEFNGTILNIGDSLVVTGGTNIFNTDVELHGYTFINGGTNGGTGAFTIVDTLRWMNGSFADSGSVHIMPGAVALLEGTNSKILMGRHILNDGKFLIKEGSLYMSKGSAFYNHDTVIVTESGTLTMITNGTGAGPSFFNQQNGVFIKRGGSGISRIAGINFFNEGLIDLDHTIMNLDGYWGGGVYTQNSGTTRLDSSRFISTKEIRIDSGLFTGTGIVEGDLYNAGIVDPGSDSTHYGVIFVYGNYTQDTCGTLVTDIGGRSPKSGYDQLTVNTASLSGLLDLQFHTDSVFNPYYGTRFRVMRWLESEYEGNFDSITNILYTVDDGTGGPVEKLSLDPVYTVNDLTIFGRNVKREMWFQFIGRDKARNNEKLTIKMFYGNKSRDTLVVPFIVTMSPNASIASLYDHFPDQLPWDPVVTRDYFHTEVPDVFLDEDENYQLPLVFSLPPDGRGTGGSQAGGTNLVFIVKPNCKEVNKPVKVSGKSGNPIDPDLEDCLWNFAGEIAGFLPGGACVSMGANLVLAGFDNRKPKTWGNLVAEQGWNVANCAVSLVPGASLVTKTASVIGGIMDGLGHSNTIISCSKVLLPGLLGKEAGLGVNCVASLDPNEKVGPDGISYPRYYKGIDPSAFSIYFENIDTATAPAQNVYITDQLNPEHWDLSGFSFLPITIGDTTLEVPMYVNSFEMEADLRKKSGVIVRIAGELDELSGLITWTFTSLDTITRKPVTDPMAGFLPPNVNYPEGQADVSYLLQPNLDLASGTEIGSDASIIFDTNEAILTNTWINTIDRKAPESHMEAIADEFDFREIPLSWSGQDMHSGIRGYKLFVSENGGTFNELLYTTDTSYLFTGEPCTEYQFYTSAIDSTGNHESPKEPEVMVTINPYISIEPGVEGALEFCAGDSTLLHVPTDTTASFTWYRNDVELSGQIDSMLYVKESGFYSVMIAGNENCSATTDAISISVNPLPEAVISAEGNTLNTASGFTEYHWYLDDVLIDNAGSNSLITSESGVYSVEVVNDKGCSHISEPFSHQYVSINSLEADNFIIYPNPGRGIFTIKPGDTFKERNLYISITDINGRYLQRSVLMKVTDGAASINLSQYPEGIYHFILKDKEGTIIYQGRFILTQ